jgi:hypothetical protein
VLLTGVALLSVIELICSVVRPNVVPPNVVAPMSCVFAPNVKGGCFFNDTIEQRDLAKYSLKSLEGSTEMVNKKLFVCFETEKNCLPFKWKYNI